MLGTSRVIPSTRYTILLLTPQFQFVLSRALSEGQQKILSNFVDLKNGVLPYIVFFSHYFKLQFFHNFFFFFLHNLKLSYEIWFQF